VDNIPAGMIIPGPKKPKLDTFPRPLVDELTKLDCGTEAFDANTGRTFMLRVWVIMGPDFDSWYAKEDLDNAADLVKNYEERHSGKQQYCLLMWYHVVTLLKGCISTPYVHTLVVHTVTRN
jgi:hypothetical protein